MDKSLLGSFSFSSFLDHINLNEKAKGIILSSPLTHDDISRGYEAIINGEDVTDALRALSLVASAAYEITLPEYRKRDISVDIAIATLSDIARWEEEYERTHEGRPGLSEIRWLKYHLQLQLFALGSLQYQLLPEEDGIFTLNLHIPKDSDISLPSVLSSFEKTRQFFKKDKIKIKCFSWLLSDELSSLLDDSSRIKAFSSLFTKVSSDYGRRQAEERIFGHLEDNPENYEVETSLATKAREYLMKGGKLPVTSGFLII